MLTDGQLRLRGERGRGADHAQQELPSDMTVSGHGEMLGSKCGSDNSVFGVPAARFRAMLTGCPAIPPDRAKNDD